MTTTQSTATSRSARSRTRSRSPVELGGVEAFPGGPRHAGFEATTQIKRKDFDIDVALPPGVSAVALGDVIKIEIDLQLLEPDVAG